VLHGVASGGIILLPTFLVGEDLRAGRLVRLLPDYPPPEQALYALYSPGRHLSAKGRSFVDFLIARFSGEPAWDRYWREQGSSPTDGAVPLRCFHAPG
jgi:DNA-binding transcriptional LysR family regulator